MRVPLNWLAEYVDLPGNATPDSVMAELVKVGLEEEGSHGFDVTGPVVVGEVLEFTPEEQSNGKTIRWCQVRVAPMGEQAADGGESVRGIVCGASNFEVGDKVVVCLPGSVLPGPFAIAARKTYGHISDGMLASGRELGLNDDHGGIIRLQQMGLDPKVGTDARELLCLDDSAAEINVTPDRGYCLSIRGVAREYSHATGAAFRDPAGNAEPQSTSGYNLSINDQAPIRGRAGCTRFVLRQVTGVDASRPTPPWMVSRLKLAGMRSISLIVDVTNYVMLELGQPTHAYDYDKLTGGIEVRRAKKGETLKTLDGQVRTLHPEDLVIADESGAIGLAGVMGGESTEVSDTTVNVLIEAANFDPISIARSARRHKLPSEASKRFERGVDHSMAKFAAARVVQLLEVHGRGEAQWFGADYRGYAEQPKIWLPEGFASQMVGVDYTAAEISEVLHEIGCVVAHVSEGFEVIPPTWRPDLTHKTDLVEEIARITGYDRIPVRLPVAPPGRGLTRAQQQRRRVANALAAAGSVEVLNYPFVTDAQLDWVSVAGRGSAHAVKLANPLQGQASNMRVSLLPALIEAAARNYSRGLTNLSIFEQGLVFHPAKQVGVTDELPVGNERPSAEAIAKLEATIPNQPRHIAALFLGDRNRQQVGSKTEAAGYQDAIQAARTIGSALGVEIQVMQSSPKGFHPGRTAELFVATDNGNQVVGYAGELDPTLTAENHLPRRVGVLEINLDQLGALAPETVQAAAVHIQPAATQDVSLLVAAEVPAETVRQAIIDGAGELLEHIQLTDDYRGSGIDEGKKSLTFAMRFRATDRTLTQAEASDAKEAGVQVANERFGATIRG
ncbi:MAG: phenylalanine--tRNA ligase subunit beta [Micrococcales bacterium]